MSWPLKCGLLGIELSVTDYRQAVAAICAAARQCQGGAVAALSIHSIMLGTVRAEFGNQINSLELATPDGQGSRWALNWIHQANLQDRVYGPRLMLELVEQAAHESLPIFLYGSTPEVGARLQRILQQRFPGLRIVGVRSPPFRALTNAEDAADMAAIRESGARFVFVGLGCPRQEVWVVQHRGAMDAVLIAVGAAFDFLSGNKRQAPVWIQRCGLEMVFRMCMEPRRLWRRFFYFSPLFVLLVLLQKLKFASFPGPGQIRILGLRILEKPAEIAQSAPPLATSPRS